jgi:hypothetical protein
MPTLQEISDKIDLKYPNGATDAQVVTIIDTLQKRLYRKFRIPTKTEYDLIADTYAYNLGIKSVLIFDVLVDGTSYPKKQLTGQSTTTSKYHYFIDDNLAKYPTPEEDGTLSVFHYSSPDTLSSSNMGVTPQLDEDYHDIFVYGVCKELAENDQRYDVASGFAIQYIELESELAELFKILPEVKTIEVESGW